MSILPLMPARQRRSPQAFTETIYDRLTYGYDNNGNLISIADGLFTAPMRPTYFIACE